MIFIILKLIIGLFCVLIYTPLCFIRDLKKFARFHFLADVIILTTVICIFVFATLNIKENGEGKGINPI